MATRSTQRNSIKSIISSRKRHIVKAITWRMVGTIDTLLLTWFITGDPMLGLQISFFELITKMGLYYAHERVWFNLRIFNNGSSHIRHILKTITWRFVGTLDTIILSWALSGSGIFGLSIGGLEIITKMILYYAHERVWYRSKFGLGLESRGSI